jgi:SAM-dependent methyltransferase
MSEKIDPSARTVLHVGCGPRGSAQLPAVFHGSGWREIRVDIDPGVGPDVVASMTDMAPVASGSVDAVYSCHNLEHLYAHEVDIALREFRRVLRDSGFAVILVPDLQAAARLIVEDKLDQPAYISPAGPITPLDMLYGYRPMVASGNPFMTHKTGFSQRTLAEALIRAGFGQATVSREQLAFNLWAVAHRSIVPGSQTGGR